MNGFLKILAEYDLTAGAGGAHHAAAPRAVTAEEVFGHLSQRADAAGTTGAAAQLAEGFSSTTLFHAAAVLLLVCYVLVLYRHPEILKSLREHIFSTGAGRNERLNDNRHDPLRGFSWGRMLLDTLFVCTAVVRLADLLMPTAAAALPPQARLLAVPIVAGVFCATVAYQNTMLALAGAVTVSRPLTSAIGRIRSIYFRLATVVLTPVLLLWVLSPAGRGVVFEAVIALQVIFIAVAFLRETFLLFISKKLSIYHWFLYLCTVEAFPLSLVCLLAVRG